MAYQPKSYRKFLTGAVTTAVVASSFAGVAGAAANNFTDVNDSYKAAVDYLVSKGINGTSATTFGVSDKITRLDAAIFVAKALELNVNNAPAAGFTDVPANRVQYVNALKAAGITNGTSDTTFGAYDLITRGQLAKWLVTGFGLKGSADISAFNDVPANYADAVKTLVANNITNGTSAATFGTKDNAKRGDFAIFVKKSADAVAPVADPKVESVSAINAKQVEVKFNKAIDKATVIDSANGNVIKNIAFAASTATSSTSTAVTSVDATGSLSEDGKTLTITLANNAGNIFNGTYTLTTNADIKTTAKENLKDYSTSFSITDKTAPVVASVEAKTNTTTATSATVEFSEPVSASVIKIDGTVVTPASGAGTDKLVFNGLSLSTSKEHTVEVLNATDYNNNVTALQTKTFSVTQDTVAPVASVQASGDHAIKLTFDKDMTVATVAGATKVLDEKLGTTASTVTQVGTSKKEFLVTITDGTIYDNASSRSFTVVVDDTAKDSLGNKVSTTTKAVALAKDVTAPTVTNVSVVNDANGNAKTLKVTFSEELKAKPADLTAVTAKDAVTGASVVANTVLDDTAATIVLSDDKKTIEIPVLVAAQGNKYNFAFAKGFVKDTALTANDSVAYAKTVAFDKAGTAFKLVQGDLNIATQNKIVITFAKDVVGDFGANAANNPANYTVAGKALPADTDITIDGTRKVVTFTLPSDFVAKTDTNAVFTVNNVKAIDGSALAAFVGYANVKDNIAPVLSKTAWNANGSFTLDFNEDIATLGAAAGYEVKVNNSKLPVASYALSAGTGSDNGNVVVTFTTANDVTYGDYIDVDGVVGYTAGTDILVGNVSNVSVKVLAAATTADAAGNVAKADVTVSASK